MVIKIGTRGLTRYTHHLGCHVVTVHRATAIEEIGEGLVVAEARIRQGQLPGRRNSVAAYYLRV